MKRNGTPAITKRIARRALPEATGRSMARSRSASATWMRPTARATHNAPPTDIAMPTSAMAPRAATSGAKDAPSPLK
jgi:hypothetical protein